MSMKYIIFKDPIGFEHAILFSEAMSHNDIPKIDSVNMIAAPIAAGFCNISGGINSPVNVTCFGKSHGLKIVSRGEQDAILIKQTITFKI